MINIHTLINQILIVLILLQTVLDRLLGISPIVSQILVLCLFSASCFWGFTDKNYYKCYTVTPIVFWGIWVAYTIVNWYMAGIMPKNVSSFSFLLVNLLLPLIMLVLVYYEAGKNMRITIITLLVTLIIYTLLGLLMQDFGTRHGQDWNARGGEVLGNHLPLTACSLVFITLFANITKIIKSKYMYLTVTLAIIAILLVATRKALGAVVIMIICFVLATSDFRKKWKELARLSAILLLITLALVYVRNETLIGKRMENVEMIGNKLNKSGMKALNLLGDRVPHYLLGWKAFKENPITGVGITNVTTLYHFPYPLHTEYMTQLAEGGIIGTFLWLLFTFGLLHVIYKARKFRPISAILVCFSGILYILFLDLTSWTYASPHYFAVYGLIIAYCKPVWLQRFYKLIKN